MKFQQEKKQEIISYLLEKIARGDSGISKAAAENFDVNQNTIHRYLNELSESGIIERVKYGQYALINKEYTYHLYRSRGDLNTDLHAYSLYLSPYLSDYAANVREIWQYSFSEMFNNVMDHSGAENVIIKIVQNYLKTAVYITDDGIGIFKKIKDYFGFDTLEDAISELFKGKLTTDSANHSGEGIFFTSRIMDSFAILSDSKVFSCDKYDPGIIENVPAASSGGTCVIMSLSNFSRKKASEIFDRFADVDSGFTKTRIPMKNMFDTSPISRSQAKRVCYRLDSFQEVVIDFADVEWMGQGFAHQLFVVFQNEHPDIKLVPVNMSTGVEKMYRHVMA